MAKILFRVVLAGHLMAVVVLLAAGASTGSPQDPPPEGKKDKLEKEGSTTEAEKEIRRASEQVVSAIDLEVRTDDAWSKVKRIEKPVLLFGDSTRDHDRGSLWVWGEKGRPVAVLELFQAHNDRTEWVFSITNTSGGKLRATRAGAPWWRENDSDVELKDIPQAPAPAADSTQRQRQMKLLAQKFRGHEFWNPNNSRYELRRIERPVHTYQDEAAGVLDGGLFILANGTNPEILLFLEARVDPKDKSKPVWQFLVGRSAHAELHLEYDGKEVFNAPRGFQVAGPNRPYWLNYIYTNLSDPEK